MVEGDAVRANHVIHADRGDCLQPRVDLGRADGEVSAAANAKHADRVPFDERLRAQEINCGAEILGQTSGNTALRGWPSLSKRTDRWTK